MADRFEQGNGGLQQRLSLVGTHFRQLGVAAGNQALARIVRVGEFEQVALIKEPQLQCSIAGQHTQAAGLQCGDPLQSGVRLERIDMGLGDHATVAHQHHLVDAKALTQLPDLWHERVRVGRVALKHRNGNRHTARIGKQSIVDLQLAALAVTVVPEGGQLTGAALEVARSQVIQHDAAGLQVTLRELALDRILALEQPVHRGIQRLLITGVQFKQLRHGGGVPPARGGELAVGP
ncbi:hypothetical protein AWB78_08681 [Caballeronia calidae]|uniref:Uncharacterized protein n=1 Tax=Caballeronia calidae TaxID=1777139 RepID=A0A158ELB7_9BURK|nr:hypothetical protein AWB78_08681 [Caballeronia calidae]